jgi:hypothetical protein
MNKKIEKAVKLSDELGVIFNSMVNEVKDLDLKRLFKQLEADMMDTRHKLALAARIINSKDK